MLKLFKFLFVLYDNVYHIHEMRGWGVTKNLNEKLIFPSIKRNLQNNEIKVQHNGWILDASSSIP